MDFTYYFQSYDQYFWQWEENGQVIAIPNGSTIGYFETIVSHLKSFENQCLPRFGSLLLATIATNNTVSDDLHDIESLMELTLFAGKVIPDNHRNVLKGGIKFLRVLQQLPKEYKSGPRKNLLLQLIFNDSHNQVGLKASAAILSKLRKGPLNEGIPSSKKPFDIRVFLRDFRILSILFKHFPNAERIIEQMAGMPQMADIIALDDNEETQGSGEKDFIDDLIQHPKTFQVGALVKRIWSGLTIPYHLANPGGQPLGGVSDITNKGDFSQLLISEFANDDIIFLSRLANSEALYLRREEPPASDQFERVILIDVSIKNWGTPKILAYAVAVAIANHPKTDIRCVGFAVGNEVHEIYFQDVHQIIDSMMKLDHCLHPASGLEEFLKNHSSHNSEIFFISTEEVIRFPEMQRILNEYHAQFKYWVNVDSEGNIRLFKNQYKTKRLIQDIHLPLDELWSKKKPKSLPHHETEEDTHDYSLLLYPYPMDFIKFLPLSEKVQYVIAKNMALYKVAGQNKGMKHIMQIPDGNKGCKFEMGFLDNNQVVLLCYLPQRKQIRFYNLTTGQADTKALRITQNNSFPEFFFYENDFYYFNSMQYWKISYHPEIQVQTITRFSIELKEAYQKRMSEIRSLNTHYFPTVLRNVKHVFINDRGNLVLNTHELSLEDRSSTLQFQNAASMKATVTARTVDKKTREFTFPDGSKLKVDVNGIVTLKSASSMINDIFIPSVLQRPLAASTQTEFAGSDYFRHSTRGENVEMSSFYNDHIIPFIDYIQSHGDKN